MQNEHAQVLLELVEIAVAMQKNVPMREAEGCDQAINRSAHGLSCSAEFSIVARAGNRERLTAGLKYLKCRKFPESLREARVGLRALQHFT